MDMFSKRLALGILGGMVAAILFSLGRLTCWAPVLAVFVGAVLADVSGPKQGAVVGAVVVLPIGALALIQSSEYRAMFGHEPVLVLLTTVLGAIVIMALGALYGCLVGLLFRATKGKKFML